MEWIKLDVEITKDLRLRGFTPDEIVTWLSMMCIAGRENGNKRGRLRVKKRNARIDEIAVLTGVDAEVVASTIGKAMTASLLLQVVDDETGEFSYEIADWDLTQLDRTAAARQQESRANKAACAASCDVTRDGDGHTLDETRRDLTTDDVRNLDRTQPTYLYCETAAFEANCGPLEYSLAADSYGDPNETASSPYSDEDREALDHDRSHQMLCEAMLTPRK